jgi:transketolase
MVFDEDKVGRIAQSLRCSVLQMITAAGSGHPGGSLSAADIMATLYFGGRMLYDPAQPQLKERDRFILSKGHAAPILYAALAEAGFFAKDEILTLRQLGSRLQGHPDMNKLPGVEVSTGSLGQGLSIASGLALGLRFDGNAARVFVLLGDGELQEGQVWEAAMYAAQQKLDNIIAIVDNNNLQIDGAVREICNPHSIAAKFSAFGWQSLECDGHSVAAIDDALHSAIQHQGGPAVIVARTVKGKGVGFMENQCGWHGKAPSSDQCAAALAELQESEVC